MRRYKIIRQDTDNGIDHYELWFEHKFLWTTRWRAVQDWRGRCRVIKHFEGLGDIYTWMRDQRITRTVVEEGVVKE